MGGSICSWAVAGEQGFEGGLIGGLSGICSCTARGLGERQGTVAAIVA